MIQWGFLMDNPIIEYKKKQRKNINVDNVANDPLVKMSMQAEKADDPDTLRTMTVDATCFDEFFIMAIGDVHIGGPGTNLEKYIRTLQAVKPLNNKCLVLLGDIVDNATLEGVSNPHESTLNPQQETKVAIKLHIDDDIKSNIVAMIGGNHDGAGNRNRDTMSSQNKYIATALNLYEVSTDYIGRVIIKLRTNIVKEGYVNFEIIARHGSGRAPGGYGGALDSTAQVEGVYNVPDMELTGHFHANETGEYVKEARLPNGKRIYKNVYVRSVNSFQEYAPYAATNAMAPSNTDATIFRIKVAPNPIADMDASLKDYTLPYRFEVEEYCIDSPEFKDIVEQQKIGHKLKEQDIDKMINISEQIDNLFEPMKITNKNLKNDRGR